MFDDLRNGGDHAKEGSSQMFVSSCVLGHISILGGQTTVKRYRHNNSSKAGHCRH